MVARASVCLTMHNRLSDTNRPLASSTGLATVLPMDYASQTMTVAMALPRLPHELDIWQFIIKDDRKGKRFEVPVNVALGSNHNGHTLAITQREETHTAYTVEDYVTTPHLCPVQACQSGHRMADTQQPAIQGLLVRPGADGSLREPAERNPAATVSISKPRDSHHQ